MQTATTIEWVHGEQFYQINCNQHLYVVNCTCAAVENMVTPRSLMLCN